MREYHEKNKMSSILYKKERTKEDAGKILIVDDKNLATFLSVFLYKIKIKIGFGSLHIRHQP